MTRVGLTGGLGSGKSAVALVFAEGGAHVISADELGRALMQPGQTVYQQIVAHFGAQVVQANGQLDRRALAAQAFQHGRLQELNAIVHPAVFAAQDEQMRRLAAKDPDGIAVLESALIFEVLRDAAAGRTAMTRQGSDARSDPASSSTATASHSAASPRAAGSVPLHPARHELAAHPFAAGWRHRFDRLVLVAAPEELKISRYLRRTAPPDASQSTLDALAHDARARLAAQVPDADKIPFSDFVIENTTTLVLLRRKAQAVLAALRAQPPDQQQDSPRFF